MIFKKRYSAIFLVAMLASTSSIAEDVTNAFIKCAITKGDKARLACYDKIRDEIVAANSPKPSQVKDPYAAITLADLKTDIKTLKGKKFAVKAAVQTMGEMSMLKSDPMDMSPIFAATESLPREDRKKLLNGCQIVICSGVFYGTVKALPLGIGLALERVVWN